MMRLIFYISLFLILPAFCFDVMAQNPIPRIEMLPDVTIRKGYFEPVTITLGPCDGSSTTKKQTRILYIVDGEIWKEKNISEIGIKNIASINILKDPKEILRSDLLENITGVVLITTKKKH